MNLLGESALAQFGITHSTFSSRTPSSGSSFSTNSCGTEPSSYLPPKYALHASCAISSRIEETENSSFSLGKMFNFGKEVFDSLFTDTSDRVDQWLVETKGQHSKSSNMTDLESVDEAPPPEEPITDSSEVGLQNLKPKVDAPIPVQPKPYIHYLDDDENHGL